MSKLLQRLSDAAGSGVYRASGAGDIVEAVRGSALRVARISLAGATDKEALHALQVCTQQEGIIPALEPAHALAYVTKLAPTLPKDNLLVMNLCGRGDKDLFTVAKHLGMKI